MMKKIYNAYRNCRSKIVILFNKLIYKNKFIFGKNFYVRKNFCVVIEENGQINIGDDVFFNNNCSINSIKSISIGNDCIFGENVHIYDHNHKYDNKDIPINKQGFNSGNINIGNNCWIGSNVIILKGVTIGNHCIIGANCVIFEDVEDNSVLINNQQLKNIKKVVK